MENNNNSRGIFYGVIGVATLVVAIIGATFAFFTASVSQNYAINGVSSGTVDLEFDEVQKNFKTGMIPVKTAAAEVLTLDHDNSEATAKITAFAEFPGFGTGPGKGSCTDLVGNDICSIYTFTISNPEDSTITQDVLGSLTVNVNGKQVDGKEVQFTNLKYALFLGNGTSSNVAEGGIKYYDVNDTAVAAETTPGTRKATGTLLVKGTFGAVGLDTTGAWGNTKVRLGTTDTTRSVTYTMVIWLEDAGTAQDAEQDLPFAASITFQSDASSGGVTGVITAG